MKYAPKEVQRHLPKAKLFTIHWRWWWFKGGYGFLSQMRIANALCISVGPIDMVIRRPYLIGPARQLHPEAFIRAWREDLLRIDDPATKEPDQ